MNDSARRHGTVSQSAFPFNFGKLQTANWKVAKIATGQRTDNVEGLKEALVTQCGQYRGVEMTG